LAVWHRVCSSLCGGRGPRWPVSVLTPAAPDRPPPQLEQLRRRKQEADARGDAAAAAALAAEMKPLRERLRLVPFSFDKT
jgi:hypothetical protein